MIGIIDGATVGVITGDVFFNLDFASVNVLSFAWVVVSVGSSRGLVVLNPVLIPAKSDGVSCNPLVGGVDVITVAGACSCLGLNRPCPPVAKSSANNPPAGAVGLAGAWAGGAGLAGGAVGAVGLKRPAPVDISAKKTLVCGGCVKMLVAGGGWVKMLVAGGVDVADCGMGCPNTFAENIVNGWGWVALDDGIAGVNVLGLDAVFCCALRGQTGF